MRPPISLTLALLLGSVWFSVGSALAGDPTKEEQQRAIYRNQAMESFHRGQGHQAEKKYTDALIDLNQAINCFEKAGDANRAERMESFDRVGQIEEQTGHGEAAEDAYRSALSIAARRFGTGEPALLPYLKKCGAAYYKHRKFDEAAPIYKQAYEIANHNAGSMDAAEVTALKEKAADALERAGNYPAAEPMLKECIEKHEKDGDADSPQLLSLLNCYSELMRKTNREAEGDQIEAKIDAIHNKSLNKTDAEPDPKAGKDASPVAK